MTTFDRNFAIARSADIAGKSAQQISEDIPQKPESIFKIDDSPTAVPLLRLYQVANKAPAPEIQVLKNRLDFYQLNLGMTLIPEGHEQFKRIDFKVVFDLDKRKLNDRCKCFDLLPMTRWQEKFRIQAGVSVKVGLDAGLHFDITQIGGKATAEINANALISVPFDYSWKALTTVSTGVNCTSAQWILKEKEMAGDLGLLIVAAVPKGTEEMNADMYAEAGIRPSRFGDTYPYQAEPLHSEIFLDSTNPPLIS